MIKTKKTVLLLIFLFGFLHAQQGEELTLMLGLLSPDEEIQKHSARILVEKDNLALAAPFIDILYFKKLSDDALAQLEKLTHKRFGKNWPKWAEWMGRQEIENSLDYKNFKRFLFSKVDPQFSSFLNPRFPTTVRWDEIVWGGAEKDGIPSLNNPLMIKGDAAGYIDAGEPIFGLAVNGEYHAYPLRIFNWHEMINIKIGGKNVSISYCTLCGAAIPFDAEWNGRVFTFGSSGLLYRSNKLMYDKQTNSLWSSFEGKPVSGIMAQENIQLKTYPIVRTTWEEWKNAHPSTLLLDINTGFKRLYTRFGGPYNAYFRSSKMMFPITWRDFNLPAKEWIYGIHLNGESKAYPLNEFDNNTLVHDSFEGQNFLLIGDEDELTVRAYMNEDYKFTMTDGKTLRDSLGNTWFIHEDGLVSEDNSKKLARYPGHLAYWFAWYQFFMDTEIYNPKNKK